MERKMNIESKQFNKILYWVVTIGDYSYASKSLSKAIFKCIDRCPHDGNGSHA